MISMDEPADGTRLVVDHGSGTWEVIWRDDALAARACAPDPMLRWFNGSDPIVESWPQRIEEARGVYALGDRVSGAA